MNIYRINAFSGLDWQWQTHLVIASDIEKVVTYCKDKYLRKSQRHDVEDETYREDILTCIELEDTIKLDEVHVLSIRRNDY